MNNIKDIERSELLNHTQRLVWIYSQVGYGKTTLMQQHYLANNNKKLWLSNRSCAKNELTAFIQDNDKATSTIYIDDIHLFENEWLAAFFSTMPINAKVIVSSRSFMAQEQSQPQLQSKSNATFKFKGQLNISLTLLNQFQVIDFHQLRLNYSQILKLLPAHNNIQASDVYSISLGWPLLVNLICKKIALARDIEHLKHLVNSPPCSIVNFAQQLLLNNNVDNTFNSNIESTLDNIDGSAQQFLLWLSLVETLPKAILSNTEQLLLDDYCEHELNGLALHHEFYWMLLPVLRHACFISLHKTQAKVLKIQSILLAQRFLAISDLKSAITLLLQVGEKEKALGYLSKMGRMIEWFSHGLTNLIELNSLFSQQDAEQYEPVAWLSCLVNYKLGNVTIAREIVDHWVKSAVNSLVWITIDAMIKLNEGFIFESKHLARLDNVAKNDEQSGPFTGALINNILAIASMQKGENRQAAISIEQARDFYQQIGGTQYGHTFLSIHQSHSLLLSLQLTTAKQLLTKVNSEIQRYFSKDKSIRIALQVVKLELNFLTGLAPAVRTVDQLIKKLNKSESWFDLHATLYPIAVKLAISQRSLHYIPKWFAIAFKHSQANPMAYIDVLLSQLARLVIAQHPEMQKSLERYVIELIPGLGQNLPWRIVMIAFEIMVKTKCYDISALDNALVFSKENNNDLFFYYAKTIKALATSSLSLTPSLPEILIEELEQQQLFGLLWQMKQYIPQASLKHILKENNRLSLYSNEEQLLTEASVVLSKKELDIHQLLRSNLRNKQIALELDISEQTVKFHLKNIYRKLGVKSRKEAALCQSI